MSVCTVYTFYYATDAEIDWYRDYKLFPHALGNFHGKKFQLSSFRCSVYAGSTKWKEKHCV